jgi:chitinase
LVQFTKDALKVSQVVGTVALTVQRVGSTLGTVTVAYATANGTATAPADYGAVSGTLNCAAGDSTDRAVSIPIVNRGVVTPDRSFSVTLSAPLGATLGTSVATITIHK